MTALIVTVYTPLFDQSIMFLTFAATMFTALFLGRGPGLLIATLSILAIDYFYIGTPLRFDFNATYLIEGSIFLSLVYLLSRLAEQRDKANLELIRLKDEFLFLTAHDLRSPFSSALLTLEKYGLPNFTATTEYMRDDMHTVRANIKQAVALTERLTILAQSENPYTHREPLELGGIVEEVLRNWQSAMDERSLHVAYEKERDLKITGDRTIVHEILDNLIGNAVKYNKEGGEITVRHVVDNSTVALVFVYTNDRV